MSELLLYFLVAFVLSFVGGLPLGLITLNIVQRTVQNGIKAGIMVSLGATIIEFAYTYVALVGLDMFATSDQVNLYINVAATVVFFSMAIYFLFKKNDDFKKASDYNYFDFFRGIMIASMNVLIIPFWVFITLWLMTYNFHFEKQPTIISFSIGSALGALAAFVLYIYISDLVMKKSAMINKYTNKVIAFVFLGLGIFQLYKFLQ